MRSYGLFAMVTVSFDFFPVPFGNGVKEAGDSEWQGRIQVLSGLSCAQRRGGAYGKKEEDAVYMGMKNDLAFIMDTNLFLYEHQSTYNPNMPLRDLFYIASEYQKLVDKKSL